MDQAIVNQPVSSVFSELSDQIEQLLLLLSERERFVIEKRFALSATEKSTLEEIGQSYNVTRERVRQIEKNALQKLRRNIVTFRANEINDIAYNILQENGGIMKEDDLISKVLLEHTDESVFKVLFLLSLDKRFERKGNTIAYYPFFKLVDFNDGLIDEIARKGLDFLSDKSDVVSIKEVRKKIISHETFVFEDQTLLALFEVFKQFKIVDNNVGLITWKHIHPRTLRDKIFFILRGNKKPLHFIDIANSIIERRFDKKTVNLQAVHNELIRNEEFVLIGRGIYALKEWGYSSGTVAEVITDILNEHGNMSEEEIITEVLKKRKVKNITIILNLKNKKQFVRIGRKRYSLKDK